jgi:hypothetical protein
MGVPPVKVASKVHEIWMLELDNVVRVGVSGASGVVAGIISMCVEGYPNPTAFFAMTLKRYFCPVVNPEVK